MSARTRGGWLYGLDVRLFLKFYVSKQKKKTRLNKPRKMHEVINTSFPFYLFKVLPVVSTRNKWTLFDLLNRYLYQPLAVDNHHEVLSVVALNPSKYNLLILIDTKIRHKANYLVILTLAFLKLFCNSFIQFFLPRVFFLIHLVLRVYNLFLFNRSTFISFHCMVDIEAHGSIINSYIT